MKKIKSHIELVLEISEMILNKIDLAIDKIPHGFDYPIKSFRIMKTRRVFDGKAVDLLEINPIASRWPMGTKGAVNATWIFPDGDKTVNLPPPHVLAEFWKELEDHLSE